MRPTGHIRERSPGSWELRYSLRNRSRHRQAARGHHYGSRAIVGLQRKNCGVCCARSILASTLIQLG